MKIKYLLTTLLLSSLMYSSFAQLPIAQEQNNKNKWSCVIAINSTEGQIGEPEWDSWGYAKGNFNNFGDITNKSLSLSIIPKYFICKDILLRFEFGITKINLSYYNDNNPNSPLHPAIFHSIMNQSIEQNIYRYIPGIQWNFVRKKFIESYFGLTGAYLNYTAMHYHNVWEDKSLPSNTYTGGYDDRATATGGFAAGIGAFAGFNVYLQKHISIGAEFSSALLYKKIGGVFSGVVVNQSISKPPTTEIYSFSSNSFKGVQFSKAILSFNISIWL